jgi:hypothetical protein
MTLPRPVSATCLGQLLIAAGMLGRATLDTALERQRLRNRRLGELLVEMGLLDAPDLNAVLVLQDDLRGGRAGELAGLIGGRLGIILLCSSTITRAQLDRAIAEHDGSGMMLGQVLVAHGAISRAQLEHALDCQNQKPELRPDRYKLGRMLVAERVITQAQLDEALSRQAVSTQRLGDVLIQAGVLAPSRFLEALARQRHLISAAVAGFTLAATLASAVPQAMMAAAVI